VSVRPRHAESLRHELQAGQYDRTSLPIEQSDSSWLVVPFARLPLSVRVSGVPSSALEDCGRLLSGCRIHVRRSSRNRRCASRGPSLLRPRKMRSTISWRPWPHGLTTSEARRYRQRGRWGRLRWQATPCRDRSKRLFPRDPDGDRRIAHDTAGARVDVACRDPAILGQWAGPTFLGDDRQDHHLAPRQGRTCLRSPGTRAVGADRASAGRFSRARHIAAQMTSITLWPFP
jgi:hypothetical protein